MALTFTDSTINTADDSAYTFSSRSFGTAGASRVMVCVAFSGGFANGPPGSRTISSMTIGGVSATFVARLTSTDHIIRPEIWYAAVPTGTTGDVVVNWAGGDVAECGVGLWRIDEGIHEVSDTDEVSESNPAANTLSVLSGDYVIGISGSTHSPTSNNWTGVTQRFYEDIEVGAGGGARAYTGADATASSTDASYNLQIEWTSGGNESLVSAVFRPLPSGAAAGTVAVSATSAPNKRSSGAVTGTSAVGGIGAPTFESVGESAGTAAVAALRGYLATSAATSAVAAQGEATAQSAGAMSGSVNVTAVSNATKQSVGAADGIGIADAELFGFKRIAVSVAGTSAVGGIGAPTFSAVGEVTCTSAVAGLGEATKQSAASVTASAAVTATSNATKASSAAAAGTVGVASVSNATKQSAGLVAASQTVAAVAATSESTKQSVAAISNNISVILGVGASKLSIHPKAVLNDVSDPSQVTLHDLPDPVPLNLS